MFVHASTVNTFQLKHFANADPLCITSGVGTSAWQLWLARLIDGVSSVFVENKEQIDPSSPILYETSAGSIHNVKS